MHIDLHMKCPPFLLDFNKNLNVLTHFINTTHYESLNRASVHCLLSLEPPPPRSAGYADRKARFPFFLRNLFGWWGHSRDLISLLLSLPPVAYCMNLLIACKLSLLR
jgi:hypothetical protein